MERIVGIAFVLASMLCEAFGNIAFKHAANSGETSDGLIASLAASMRHHRFIAAGLDVKGKPGGATLTRAAGEGHLAAVQRLVALGADVNHRHDDLGSPLAAAVHRRHRDVATFLDQHGAREWQ